jgi:hypothetical protein
MNNVKKFHFINIYQNLNILVHSFKKENMNYINALPDFLAMQKNKLCWFITQGLNEE